MLRILAAHKAILYFPGKRLSEKYLVTNGAT